MRPRLYINATVISYPTRKPARDLVVARHQQSIRDRPATESVRFKLVVSEFVHPETRTRDPDAVRAPLSTPSLLATPNTTADDDRFEERLIRTTALSPGEEPGLRTLRYRGFQWCPVTRKIGLSPHHQHIDKPAHRIRKSPNRFRPFHRLQLLRRRSDLDSLTILTP